MNDDCWLYVETLEPRYTMSDFHIVYYVGWVFGPLILNICWYIYIYIYIYI